MGVAPRGSCLTGWHGLLRWEGNITNKNAKTVSPGAWLVANRPEAGHSSSISYEQQRIFNVPSTMRRDERATGRVGMR